MKRSIAGIFFFICIKSFAQQKMIDIEGHRGCRGLMPENTIPAFIKALEIGVNTLEMDVVITKDKKVLVSHDPFMSSEFCLDANGNEISKTNEKSFNIYKMMYEEIKKFDCGSKFYSRFPEQQKFKTYKPLLEEVIGSVSNYCVSKNIPLPYFNIETKCTSAGDSIFHPAPAEFCELLMDVLKRKSILKNCIIQSFDIRTLQYFHIAFPDITLALLIENIHSPEKNIKQLGFVPAIYSPAKELVNKKLVRFCVAKKMKLIVWTVNEKSEMVRLLKMNVDGIISDYPDVAVSVMK